MNKWPINNELQAQNKNKTNMNDWWKHMHNIVYYECLLLNRLECDRPSIVKG
jgi:hypothetical protein